MSIIVDLKNGNEEVFAQVIEEHKLQIYKTAKAILKDEDDVCDAIQETLISIYKNIKSLKNEDYFRTWATRITINKCYDIIAKRNSDNKKVVLMQNKIDESEKGIEAKFIEKTDLESALALIDEDLRIVTVLYYYDDISIKDISNMLEIPLGTVKSKLSRAREKLYKILKEQEVRVNE